VDETGHSLPTGAEVKNNAVLHLLPHTPSIRAQGELYFSVFKCSASVVVPNWIRLCNAHTCRGRIPFCPFVCAIVICRMSTTGDSFNARPDSGLSFRGSGHFILFQICSTKHPSFCVGKGVRAPALKFEFIDSSCACCYASLLIPLRSLSSVCCNFNRLVYLSLRKISVSLC
jgi:hypothetical protein